MFTGSYPSMYIIYSYIRYYVLYTIIYCMLLHMYTFLINSKPTILYTWTVYRNVSQLKQISKPQLPVSPVCKSRLTVALFVLMDSRLCLASCGINCSMLKPLHELNLVTLRTEFWTNSIITNKTITWIAPGLEVYYYIMHVYLVISQSSINLLKPIGYVMHHQFNIQQLYALSTPYLCFVFIWEQTATCATYSINWLVFITETKSVYCAVWTGSLNKGVCASYLKG